MSGPWANWTAGVVGHGVNDPDRPVDIARAALWRKAKASCAENDHPGATHHPQLDRTWCYCGAVQRAGDSARWDRLMAADDACWADEDGAGL